MNSSVTPDNLHRLIKEALDSGRASSVEEAEALFIGYRLHLEFGAEGARDAAHQAALLTAVAVGRRVFLGGVTVRGALDVPLAVSMRVGSNLAQAVALLGARLVTAPQASPTITVGGGRGARLNAFHIRTLVNGWRGGIVPIDAEVAPVSAGALPLSGMLAAALAVSEAFIHIRGESGAAGHRRLGLSLWRPGTDTDWLEEDGAPAALHFLPSRLWLIGLGHLGQAYLWGLGLLPYAKPSELHLVLQDVDIVTPSSLSTSVLTDAPMVGRRKARVMADWADRHGFTTTIVERLFAADFRRAADEPATALCGIDNALGRRVLDEVGFDFVVESGLGRGFRDFRTLRLHTLPGRRRAADLWKAGGVAEDVTHRAAYQKLLHGGELDRCGVTMLAGKAVGAPFVGAVAACLVLSEVLRLLHGGPIHSVMDLDLTSIEHRSAVEQETASVGINPGFVRAA